MSGLTTSPEDTRGRQMMIFSNGPLAQFKVDLVAGVEAKVIEDAFEWPKGAWGISFEMDDAAAADAFAGAPGLDIAAGLRPMRIGRGITGARQMLAIERAIRAMRLISSANGEVFVGIWG